MLIPQAAATRRSGSDDHGQLGHAVFWPVRDVLDAGGLPLVPLVFWLAETLQPRSTVWIGAQPGTTYIAHCQAAERLSAGPCLALSGEHPAQVDDQAPRRLTAIVRAYAELAHVAADRSPADWPAPVDLLHVDLAGQGCGTALVEAWLARLSDRGLLLVEGTHGAATPAWLEACRARYPARDFLHGPGGVLVSIGTALPEAVDTFLQGDGPAQALARLGQALADAHAVECLRQQLQQSETAARSALERAEALAATERDSRQTVQTLEHSLADLRRRALAQTEQHAVERGQFGERVRLLEELRADGKTELQRTSDAQALAQREADRLRLELTTTQEGLKDARELQSAARHHASQLEHSLGLLRSEHDASARELAALRQQRLDIQSRLDERERVLREAQLAREAGERDLQERFAETASLTRMVFDLEQRLRSAQTPKPAAPTAPAAPGPVATKPTSAAAARHATPAAVRPRPTVQTSAPAAASPAAHPRSSLLGRMRGYLSRRLGRLPDHKSLMKSVRLVRQAGAFDEAWYLKRYPDVQRSWNGDPLLHFLRFGAAELRDPSPSFSTRHYFELNPDVLDAGMNPLLHYLKFGRYEERPVRPAEP